MSDKTMEMSGRAGEAVGVGLAHVINAGGDKVAAGVVAFAAFRQFGPLAVIPLGLLAFRWLAAMAMAKSMAAALTHVHWNHGEAWNCCREILSSRSVSEQKIVGDPVDALC